MKNIKFLYVIFLFSFVSSYGQLNAGDIAFIQYNSEQSPNNFGFIALVNIPEGEQITFTDNGWTSAGSFRTGEGEITWTAPIGGITCGTTVIITVTPTATVGSVTSSGSVDLSNSGDQVLAYQGSSASPTFISAIQMNGTWDTDATSASTSAIPTGLTNGLDTFDISPEVDSGAYNASTLTGDQTTLLPLINNSSNWNINGFSSGSTFSGTFTVNSCPLINTIVQFVNTTSSLTEDGVSISICAEITNEDTSPTTVEVALDGSSTAINGIDYDNGAGSPASISFPITLTFPASSSANQCFTVFISNDDLLSEGNETIVLNLQNPSGGDSASIGTNSQHTLSIIDNETPPAASVVITEIMYNTTGTDDEWIEICNVSGSTQDISNYIIDVDGTTQYTCPVSTTINNNECITIALGDNGDATFNPSCTFTPDYNSGNPTNILNNTSGTITLYAADGTTTIDNTTYNQADGANGNGSSLHVVDYSLNNSNTNTNWTEVGTGGSPKSNTLVSPCAPNINYPIDTYNGQTVYTCNGTFTDSGDTTSDYSDNENYTVTFCSGSADEVLQFIFNPQESDSLFQDHNFEITSGDILNVYDGTGTSGTLLTTITDTSDPGADHFYLYGINECLTFEFISNTSGNDNGWEALIACVPKGCGSNPAPADDFANAPYICNLDGFCATTVGYTEDLPANLTDTGGSCPTLFGGTIENNSWIQFEAASTSITLEFTVPTCYDAFGAGAPDVTEGIQSAIFEYNGTNLTRVSDCSISDGTNNGTFTLTSTTLVPGTTYYIMTDGSAGSQCDYQITVLNGGAGVALFDAGDDQSICQGDNTTLTAQGPSTATYSWTSTDPSFGTVLGNPIVVSPNATATYSVEVTSGSCLNDTDDVTVTVNTCSSSSLMITQYYEGSGTNKWIEIKNISGAIVPANSYYIVILNNTDADDPANADPSDSATPSPSFGNNILISTDMAIDEVRRFREPTATLPAYASPGETGYDGNPTYDMSTNTFSGDDIIIISSTNDGSTWANRIDVIGDGTLWGDRRCYIRNECIANGPSITFDINDWIEFTDAEVEFPVLDTNPYLGQHFQGVTTFDNTANWDNGAPDKSRILQISEDYNTSTYGSFKGCSLTIDTSTRLTVDNLTFVEIINDATVDGELYVETQGAFVQVNNTSSFTLNTGGTALVNKRTTPLNSVYDYTYWSSPIENAMVQDGLAFANPSRRYWFNAVNFLDILIEIDNTNTFTPGSDGIDDDGNDWTLITDGTDIMTPGLGYVSMHNPVGFIPGTQYTYTFSGSFNNGIVNTLIAYNGANGDEDWNLIGNPYPCAIDANAFLTNNSSVIGGAAYLWSQNTAADSNTSGNQNYNFSQDDYAIITNGSGNTAGGDMIIPNNYIPSGQSFFVQGLSNANAVFDNSLRMADATSNTQFFKSSNNLPNRLWVNLTSDNGVFNQVLIAYVDGATDGRDNTSYDARRSIYTQGAAVIYTEIENDPDRFAIQGKAPESLTLDEVIPLGFETAITVPTIYSLSIAQLEGEFLTSNTIYLKDYLLDTIHELSASEYTFISDEGNFNNRFEIVFNNNLLSTDDFELETNAISIIELENDVVQFLAPNNLIIESIKIYDAIGRELYSLKGSSNTESFVLNHLSQSAYIAHIKLSNGQIISKKAIKK